VRHFLMACYLFFWTQASLADGGGTGSNLLWDVGRISCEYVLSHVR
jgi:hypothetical protein